MNNVLQRRHFILLLFLFFISKQSCAESREEHTKIWTSAPITGSITEDKKWNYYVEPQLRFIDNKYKFYTFNLYAGIYYQTSPNLSLWLGVFRNYERSLSGNTTQQYRLWEQIIWNILNNPAVLLTTRSRLEERKRLSESEISYRFRERIALRFPIKNLDNYYWVVADEGFFQLNRPDWVSKSVFSQNRASIGIQIPVNKNMFCEIGYLNQLEYSQPNQMNNVLYIALNLSDL